MFIDQWKQRGMCVSGRCWNERPICLTYRMCSGDIHSCWGMISCWRVFADELLHYPMNCRGGTTSAIKGLKGTTLLYQPSEIVSIPLLQFLDKSIPVEPPPLGSADLKQSNTLVQSHLVHTPTHIIHQRYNYNNYYYNYKTI
jgi:hypothetical protein